ncbi:DUF6301 family protein [Nocardia goodfellowii]|uniref:Uncharacterized protein n=1 Tax=Nocardia goodfellowii TaxID=882446 RepID=A0ABS4QGF6_9NOCA|nr:DUF6301 family protein [Nocardia goodfellowii]MBP2190178.1 hypothetical protein [Nocardia goodfellowii]
MQVDTQGAVQTARCAADFDWTWSVADLGRFGRTMGWTRVKGRYGDSFETDLQVNEPIAQVGYRTDGSAQKGLGDLAFVSIFVADTSIADYPAMARVWADLFDRITEQLGAAAAGAFGINEGLVWMVPAAAIGLRVEPLRIRLEIVNPKYRHSVDSRVL